MINPSPHQQAIWRYFSCGEKDLAVIARAGSGKTTTIVGGLQFLPPGRALLCAFNTEIKDELLKRVKQLGLRNVKVLSLHGLGLATLMRSPVYAGAELEERKGHRMASLAVGEPEDPAKRKQVTELVARVEKAASLVKSTVCMDREGLRALIETHNLDMEGLDTETLAAYVRKACQLAVDEKATYDFDDMIWLPCLFQLQPPQYDYVIVDEAQDMCLAQLRLAQRARRPGGRIVVVGDPCQAIYGWRGADADAIPRMIEELQADVLPLTISYRCPRAVVELAQAYVPDLEAAPDAPEGVVEEADFEALPDLVQPGDYVLSRSNAPLLRTCMMLLRHEIPAKVIGRDVSRIILGLLRRSKAKTVQGLLDWVDTQKQSEAVRLKDRPSALAAAIDALEVLEALTEDEPDLAGVQRRLDQLFLEERADQHRVVACSTVHKAKGKERNNVFLLRETFFRWPGDEEKNVYYVALTRAKARLVMVYGL